MIWGMMGGVAGIEWKGMGWWYRLGWGGIVGRGCMGMDGGNGLDGGKEKWWQDLR